MFQGTLRRNVAEALIVSALLTTAVFLIQWRYGFNLGDEGLHWYLAQRVKFGEMAIRDSFGYDPGRYLWSAAWFKALGSDGLFEQRLANTSFGFLGLTSAYIATAGFGVRRAIRLPLAALLSLAMGYPLHKIYEQSLSLVGVAVLAYSLSKPQRSKRWILLGLLTGFAAIFGRNSGVYLAAASLLGLIALWKLKCLSEFLRGFVIYSAGVLTGYAPMIAWFAVDPKFRHAMIASILFTPQTQIPLPIPFPWRVPQSLSSVYKVQAVAVSWLCIAVFAIYAIYGYRLLKNFGTSTILYSKQILGLSALCVGLPFLHQAFDRADFGHIAQGILPLFVLIATQLDTSGKRLDTVIAVSFAALALLSWLPSEPLLASIISQHHRRDSITKYTIDGRLFQIDSTAAALLDETKLLASRCEANDGQVIAMPYFPGVFAYLHLRSPYWETYYLHKRDDAFQQSEIASLEAYATKVAVVNDKAALDGKDSLRIQATNPILYNYIFTRFSRVESTNEKLVDFTFLTRNCPSEITK